MQRHINQVPNQYPKRRKSLRINGAHPPWETHAQNNRLLKLLINLAAATGAFSDNSQSGCVSIIGVGLQT
jgi:hypothetical protein